MYERFTRAPQLTRVCQSHHAARWCPTRTLVSRPNPLILFVTFRDPPKIKRWTRKFAPALLLFSRDNTFHLTSRERLNFGLLRPILTKRLFHCLVMHQWPPGIVARFLPNGSEHALRLLGVQQFVGKPQQASSFTVRTFQITGKPAQAFFALKPAR